MITRHYYAIRDIPLLIFKGISLGIREGDVMKRKNGKTVRLMLSEELYEAVQEQAAEEFRTVPKQIIQILREKFCIR